MREFYLRISAVADPDGINGMDVKYRIAAARQMMVPVSYN